MLYCTVKTTGYARNVPRFFVFWALYQFHLWMPIWVIFLQRRGMNLSQIGTLDAIGWVVMAAAEVPTGAVADTYGRKTSLILGSLLTTFALAAVTARVLSPIFLLGYMLWGSAFTFISGADMAFLYDSLKAAGQTADYPKVAGRYMAVMQGAQGVASLVGAWVAANFDMRWCFLGSAVLTLGSAAVALTFREPPQREAEASAVRGRYREVVREALRIAVERPAVRYLVLFSAVTAVLPFMMAFILVQPYATAVGVPVAGLGAIVLTIRGVGVLGSMLSPSVAARVGNVRLVVAVPVAMVSCQLVLWAVPSQPAIALFPALALASALMRPVLSTLINAQIPSEQRATILSLGSLVWTLMLAVLEPAIFTLASRTSLPLAIGASGVVLVLTAGPVLVLWRRANSIATRAAQSGARTSIVR